jgi:hypothetical protein
VDGRAASPFIREYSIDPVWAPDGRFVVYSGPDIGTTFSIRAAASEATPHPLPALTLTRGARHITFQRGRQALVLLREEIQHKNLWLIDLETGAERQLTNFTPDFEIGDFDISSDAGRSWSNGCRSSRTSLSSRNFALRLNNDYRSVDDSPLDHDRLILRPNWRVAMSGLRRVRLSVASGAVLAALVDVVAAQQSSYRALENHFKMPEGRKIGSTVGVTIDRDGTSVWVFERCGAQNCVGSGVAPILDSTSTGRAGWSRALAPGCSSGHTGSMSTATATWGHRWGRTRRQG